MDSQRSFRLIGIVGMMAFGASMLYGNVHQLALVLAPDQMRHAKADGKLGATEVEHQLRESDAFGKAANAHIVSCQHDYNGRWDHICQIGGGIDGRTHQHIPGGVKFGVMVDAVGITGRSALFPDDSSIPFFSKAEPFTASSAPTPRQAAR